VPSCPSARTFAIALALLIGSASAQTFVTGNLVVALGDESRTFVTSANKIAENVAQGVTDPSARAFLERLAGTTVHGATYTIVESIVMGGRVVFESTDMFVTIYATATSVADGSSPAQLELRFGLVLATLALSETADVEVRYLPTGSSSDGYLMTEGALVIVRAEQIDENTVRIQGVFDGTLSRQADRMNEAHNPADTIMVRGTFDIEQVVGDSFVMALLTEREE